MFLAILVLLVPNKIETLWNAGPFYSGHRGKSGLVLNMCTVFKPDLPLSRVDLQAPPSDRVRSRARWCHARCWRRCRWRWRRAGAAGRGGAACRPRTGSGGESQLRRRPHPRPTSQWQATSPNQMVSAAATGKSAHLTELPTNFSSRRGVRLHLISAYY